MNDNARHLLEIGEPFASGLLELKGSPVSLVYCRGFRRYYETRPIVYKAGAPLYPCGNTTDPFKIEYYNSNQEEVCEKVCIMPTYALQYDVNWKALEKKSPRAVQIMKDFSSEYYYPGGWNHSMLNYKRILAEGINEYERRLINKPDSDFKTGLLDLIEGLKAYHARVLMTLFELNAPEELITALKKVPFSPAETAYEAIVSLNFCLSLDDWDNVGRLDSILEPYYNGEDMRPYLRCLMENIHSNNHWSLTLGPNYNEITRQTLESSYGLARPMIQLRVTDEMPEDLWDLATKKILEGSGQPAFYNENAIQERLKRRIPHLTDEDALEFAGGGCTETSFAGLTYAGGTDDNINVLKIFEEYMYDELPQSSSFGNFYEGFCSVLKEKQNEQMAGINAYWNERAKTCFAPIRTLFIDDCIDNETGWFQGGARYSFSIPTDSGMPNTIDSLLAIKHLIFDEKRYTADEFLSLLKAEDPAFFAVLKACPSYGVCDKECDSLANDLTTRFYEHYLTGKLDLGVGFFPTAHQFDRHIAQGACVGPTPDGRHGGEPEADSLAAVNGKAVKGPTVMLASASMYEQKDVYGIAVTNLSITRKYPPSVVRALVEGYFEMGGTQLQITAVDRETLLDARKNPDNHRDLVVRVGGYSAYFCYLSDKLKDAVIARTLFDV